MTIRICTAFAFALGLWIGIETPAVRAAALDKLPEAVGEQAKKWAVVFDFDTDSCYPSPAVSPSGVANPGLSVTGIDTSYVAGCRDSAQLENSNTYHRAAYIKKNGTVYVVHMYALYFMKDKDLPLHQLEGLGGHRHDWEYALVWTTNNVLTHASYSAHGRVTTEPVANLHFDFDAPQKVKIVYHKNGGSTHSMRFAGQHEAPENDLRRWVTPTIVDWRSMRSDSASNEALRQLLNTHDFGEADCSVNDKNFPLEITKNLPDGYPPAEEWKQAATRLPIVLFKQWKGGINPPSDLRKAAELVEPRGN